MITDLVKLAVAQTFSKFSYPLLINSYGRSGSTVLMQSIVKGAISSTNHALENISYRCISQATWDLEKSSLKNGIVYKTHDYPPKVICNNKLKMLYTFADPVDVVLSLFRMYIIEDENWMRRHYNHLKVPYNNFRKIKVEDNLQLEKHLDSWLLEDRFPIAFIKYENMWENQNDISKFLGFEIQLPPKKERKAKKEFKKEVVEELSKTYKSLKYKIDSLDDFFVNNI